MTAEADRASSPRKGRLAVRFALWLCCGAVVILAGAGIWNIALQREHMIGLMSASADRTADIILRSTREAMLANDPEGLHRILATIGSQPGIERIRIFDKQGRIHISTEPSDEGMSVDKAAEMCFGCHAAGEPLERLSGDDRVREFVCADGHDVLGVIAPIRNEPECAACHVHPADLQVLGVLDVQLSLDPVQAQLVASEAQLGLGLVITVIAMLGLVGWLVWRLVLQPVHTLEEATKRVGAGDLSTRARVARADEIGEMTRSWNAMVGDLAAARDELERWSRTLEQRVEDKTAELREAHEQMVTVEKMASLGKLAAVVAHEINNPLAGIATYARLLHRRYVRAHEGSGASAEAAADDETGKALNLVEREAVRCGEIVRNLLLFSRTPTTRVAEAELGLLFERCVMLLRHKAELAEIDVQLELAEDLPLIECDTSQVQQLIIALSMNAIEAMPEGGSLRLAAVFDQGADEFELTVADSGCGIPEEHIAHVFEPFYTTKEEGHGVGLGLAVVFGIVQRHHGRVTVDSTPDVGTTFRVRLPHRQPVAEPQAAPTLEEVLP